MLNALDAFGLAGLQHGAQVAELHILQYGQPGCVGDGDPEQSNLIGLDLLICASVGVLGVAWDLREQRKTKKEGLNFYRCHKRYDYMQIVAGCDAPDWGGRAWSWSGLRARSLLGPCQREPRWDI